MWINIQYIYLHTLVCIYMHTYIYVCVYKCIFHKTDQNISTCDCHTASVYQSRSKTETELKILVK